MLTLPCLQYISTAMSQSGTDGVPAFAAKPATDLPEVPSVLSSWHSEILDQTLLAHFWSSGGCPSTEADPRFVRDVAALHE